MRGNFHRRTQLAELNVVKKEALGLAIGMHSNRVGADVNQDRVAVLATAEAFEKFLSETK